MCLAGGAAEKAAWLVNQLADLMQKNALGTRTLPPKCIDTDKITDLHACTLAKIHRVTHTLLK